MQLVLIGAKSSSAMEECEEVVVDNDSDVPMDCSEEAAEKFQFNMDDPTYHFGDPDVQLPVDIRPFVIKGNELSQEFLKGTAQHSTAQHGTAFG